MSRVASKNLDTLNRKCNHVPVAFLNKVDSSNCPGTLLVSILIDPDRFQLNLELFKNSFIFVHFVHYMNHDMNLGVLAASVISATTPLHHRTDSKPFQGKIGPLKDRINFVSCFQFASNLLPKSRIHELALPKLYKTADI